MLCPRCGKESDVMYGNMHIPKPESFVPTIENGFICGKCVDQGNVRAILGFLAFMVAILIILCVIGFIS